MRTVRLALVVGMLLVLCGCKPAGPPPPEYAPMGSLRDVMKSIIEPNADFVWDSVSTVVTAKGTERKEPRTDEEWTDEHNHSIALVEATNLLLIPNRHVARPNEKADNPDIERAPLDIEAMMTKDRATFLNRIAGLRAAALKMLAAADARDVNGIEDAGDILDKACENCHMTYWYLPDK
jgi:hypothetical protein